MTITIATIIDTLESSSDSQALLDIETLCDLDEVLAELQAQYDTDHELQADEVWDATLRHLLVSTYSTRRDAIEQEIIPALHGIADWDVDRLADRVIHTIRGRYLVAVDTDQWAQALSEAAL